jgi:uncharacterized membrane protein
MKRKPKYEKAITLTLFAAIIAVLQLISTFVKFGPFSITLALAPIIIAGALYGVRAGTAMGAVLSLVILVMGLTGTDGGGVLWLMSLYPLAPLVTVLLILVKTTLAGFVASLVYRAIAKWNDWVATVAAGILCPVVNTGIFLLGSAVFFLPFADKIADLLKMSEVGFGLFIALAFGNFIFEIGMNAALSPVIVRVIDMRRKNKKHKY